MPRISAVHAAHKAMTQRDGRAASLRCTGRRRASAGKAARRSVVLPYRRDMPARKRSTPEDTVTARRVLLDGLARDADIFELVSELAPLHPRDNTFPGEVFVRVVGRWVEPGHSPAPPSCSPIPPPAISPASSCPSTAAGPPTEPARPAIDIHHDRLHAA